MKTTRKSVIANYNAAIKKWGPTAAPSRDQRHDSASVEREFMSLYTGLFPFCDEVIEMADVGFGPTMLKQAVVSRTLSPEKMKHLPD
jgi:hypothetical protein